MVKDFLKNKRAGFYFYLLAVIAAIVSFIYYISSANDTYGYDTLVIVLYILAILSGIIFSIKSFGEAGPIVSGILYSAIFGMLIRGRLIYFVTAIMSISDQGTSSGMLIALACLPVLGIINLFAAFFAREKEIVHEEKV